MSGDYETLEINQPKISYLTKRSENNSEKNSELKISIQFMTNEIRADAIQVLVFEKSCMQNNCKTKKIKSNIQGETFSDYNQEIQSYETIADWAADKVIGCKHVGLEGYAYNATGKTENFLSRRALTQA